MSYEMDPREALHVHYDRAKDYSGGVILAALSALNNERDRVFRVDYMSRGAITAYAAPRSLHSPVRRLVNNVVYSKTGIITLLSLPFVAHISVYLYLGILSLGVSSLVGYAAYDFYRSKFMETQDSLDDLMVAIKPLLREIRYADIAYKALGEQTPSDEKINKRLQRYYHFVMHNIASNIHSGRRVQVDQVCKLIDRSIEVFGQSDSNYIARSLACLGLISPAYSAPEKRRPNRSSAIDIGAPPQESVKDQAIVAGITMAKNVFETTRSPHPDTKGGDTDPDKQSRPKEGEGSVDCASTEGVGDDQAPHESIGEAIEQDGYPHEIPSPEAASAPLSVTSGEVLHVPSQNSGDPGQPSLLKEDPPTTESLDDSEGAQPASLSGHSDDTDDSLDPLGALDDITLDGLPDMEPPADHETLDESSLDHLIDDDSD